MRTMKITQTYLAACLGVSKPYVNRLVHAKQRPNWKRAKQLARITNTSPELWLEGSAVEIQQVLGVAA